MLRIRYIHVISLARIRLFLTNPKRISVGILYLSYDGMLEPLGQSQVLAYLKLLSSNRRIHLISFEKLTDWTNVVERDHVARTISDAGIIWHPLRYHKSPSAIATIWDIFCGILVGLWIVLRHRICLVHARSYVPSIMALVIKRLTGVKYIFDMRGFWVDERVDGGLWTSDSNMYRIGKCFERQFLLAADHVVSLTHAAVREMQCFDYLKGCMPPVTVIPTCADLTHFKPISHEHSDEGLVLGYVGTVGTWYLFDNVVRCFALLLSLYPNSKFLIVNRNEHNYIRERLDNAGISNSSVELIEVTHSEVPKQMARMDMGIFFIKPVFSKLASSPTKLAEFLGCGIPCLCNIGVGDMTELLQINQTGIVVESFDDDSLILALKQLISLVNNPQTSCLCVASSAKHFSLENGVGLYENIYQQILQDSVR
jgi:glycosyltransferase involved in cell wall biosynthesis